VGSTHSRTLGPLWKRDTAASRRRGEQRCPLFSRVWAPGSGVRSPSGSMAEILKFELENASDNKDFGNFLRRP